MKISGKRKTVIPGRFPTIFTSENIRQFEEKSDLQQSNVDENVSNGFVDSVLSTLDPVHADSQASNNIHSLDDDGENCSVLGDDNDDQISNSIDSNTQ